MKLKEKFNHKLLIFINNNNEKIEIKKTSKWKSNNKNINNIKIIILIIK